MARVLFGNDLVYVPDQVREYRTNLPTNVGVKLGIEQQYDFDDRGVCGLFKNAEALKELEVDMMLDTKLFGIPKSIVPAVHHITKMGVLGFTIAAESGEASMRAAAVECKRTYESMPEGLRPRHKPLVIGVAVLSSRPDADCTDVDETVGAWQKQTSRLIFKMLKSGIDGVVCTSRDALVFTRKVWPRAVIMATAVRPEFATWAKSDDQRHAILPRDIRSFGVELAVVSRVVTDAPNPISAMRMFCDVCGHT